MYGEQGEKVVTYAMSAEKEGPEWWQYVIKANCKNECEYRIYREDMNGLHFVADSSTHALVFHDAGQGINQACTVLTLDEADCLLEGDERKYVGRFECKNHFDVHCQGTRNCF